MNALLSRYRPRYIRALVYMLQSTEYQLSYFWKWFIRTSDFSSLEQRGQLEKTIKAKVLIGIGWTITASLWLIMIFLTMPFALPAKLIVITTTLILTPNFLAVLLSIPVWLLGMFQSLYERRVIRQTRSALSTHSAIKIDIAGSYGKTTMRQILTTILSEGKHTATAPHNYNTPLGIGRFVKALTGKEEVLVFELGEYYPGDVLRLAAMTVPQIGVITGINEAHLERFGSLESTTATIFELADYMKNQPVYVNAESALAKSATQTNHLLYNAGGCDSIRITDVNTAIDGTRFTMKIGDKDFPAQTKLLGVHNLGPIAAAAAIALSLGLTPGQIVAGIAQTKPFDHRLEPQLRGDVTYIDDSYNGNPAGVKAAIDFLQSLEGRRRFYVTPGLVEMGSRTENVHLEIGRWLAKSGIEQIVLIRNAATDVIARGLKAHGFSGKLTWFDNAPRAFGGLPNLTVAGDVVLLQNDWPDQYA